MKVAVLMTCYNRAETTFRFLRSLFAKGVGRLQPEVAVLAALLGGVLVQSLLFFARIPCTPYPMWASFGAVGLLLVVCDWRVFLRFVVLTAVVLGLTAFTFSYTGPDAVDYHFPQQILLREGWNPVYCSTIEQFDEMVGELEFHRIHALFLPNLNALCGAMVGLSTGLMVADSFLNYAVFLVLLRTAHRFAGFVWQTGSWASALFALCIAVQTKMTSFLSGQVDYLPYGTLAIVLFSAYMWYRGRERRELVLLCLALTVGALVKTTGLVCCGLVGTLLLLVSWRDRRIWLAAFGVLALVLIIGAHPLLTSSYHYKCPFYPTMSFSADYPVIDITNDFTGNADALSMGWLSRVAYAWVSPALVVAVKTALSHAPFAPEFTVVGGIEGYGTFFRMLLGLSVIAFCLSRKNAVTLLAALVFLLSNLAPVKYIGYGRYFPQIWLIPFLAVYNLMYASRFGDCRPPGTGVRAFRVGCGVALAFWVGFIGVRTVAFQGRLLRLEKLRQNGLKTIVNGHGEKLPVPMRRSLPVHYRALCGGVCLTGEQKGSQPLYGELNGVGKIIVSADSRVNADLMEWDQRYPIVDDWRSFVGFGWASAYSDLPEIIRSGQKGGIVK